MQTLYTVEVGKHDPASALEESLAGAGRSDDRAFVRDLLLGTLEHADESDAAIAPLLQGWTLDRLPVLDRIVLRMSVYELNFHKETPPAVVINEAVELAKKFSTEDSGKFVNGVLASATQLAGESR